MEIIMEKKENTFVGKHYLMKQAFGQEELHERERVCTREEPPGCQAACPLHLDIRGICGYAAKGNFSKAAALIRAVTPFLHLLAGSCSGNCIGKCTLAKPGGETSASKDLDGTTESVCQSGISMPAIEKACALYGGSGAMSRFMIPRKNKRVAVVGNDLFALACCWELGKKGYEIWWHTDCGSMQEPLMKRGLTEQEAKSDLAAFTGFRITRKEMSGEQSEEAAGADRLVSGKEEISDFEEIEKWAQEADTMCISPELWTDRYKKIPNAFTAPSQTDPAWLLAFAKHASLLADRYMQGVSLDDVKEPEVHESRLYVTMDGIDGLGGRSGPEIQNRENSTEKTAEDSWRLHTAIPGADALGRVTDVSILTKENAVAEAARCIQCQCLECVKGCVYLQHFKRNPKGAIREIYNNLSIVMGNHMANGMINACDECGQCKAACPNGFDYPDVCQIARHTMVETQKMPPSAHEFALLDQQFSNGEGFLAKPQPGFEKCRYLFFPGCQAAAVSPVTVEAAYSDLCERLEGGVGLLLGCCGAISHWAAREDLLAEAVEKVTQVWRELGEPEVICACPTCKKTLEEFTKLPTAGIWEVLLKLGIKPIAESEKTNGERIVSIHDACGARGNRRMQDEVREFVRAFGYQIEEAPFTRDVTPCCGYGGLVKYANPEVSAKKASFAAGRAEHMVLTYCMACRDQFARAGADSRHILELAYGITPEPVPDLSARRANRLKLKQRMLKELWKEDINMEEMLPVIYADGVEALMDERMILKSDIDNVLKSYRQTGSAVFDEENGWLVTNTRIGNVTFWVKFSETDDGSYLVHGAYSHRMTVE